MTIITDWLINKVFQKLHHRRYHQCVINWHQKHHHHHWRAIKTFHVINMKIKTICVKATINLQTDRYFKRIEENENQKYKILMSQSTRTKVDRNNKLMQNRSITMRLSVATTTMMMMPEMNALKYRPKTQRRFQRISDSKLIRKNKIHWNNSPAIIHWEKLKVNYCSTSLRKVIVEEPAWNDQGVELLLIIIYLLCTRK